MNKIMYYVFATTHEKGMHISYHNLSPKTIRNLISSNRQSHLFSASKNTKKGMPSILALIRRMKSYVKAS